MVARRHSRHHQSNSAPQRAARADDAADRRNRILRSAVIGAEWDRRVCDVYSVTGSFAETATFFGLERVTVIDVVMHRLRQPREDAA